MEEEGQERGLQKEPREEHMGKMAGLYRDEKLGEGSP